MSNLERLNPDLPRVLRRLKLGPMMDTLPERLVLARQRKTPYEDFLLLILGDEVSRRDALSGRLRAEKARLDPQMLLEAWDDTAAVRFDRELWAELCTLRFVERKQHLLLLGAVGVGKTFLANALGHIACRRGYSVLTYRAEAMLKELKAARLTQTYEAEMRRLLKVDLLIVDDFGLDQLDATESRDIYEIIVERHGKGSLVVTSNREPQEWLSLMTDPIRAQSAIDRLVNAAHELVIEGESYRKRQKPKKGGATA